MHGIFSPHDDDLKQIKTTVHDTIAYKAVDVNILYNNDYRDVIISTSLSYVVTVINLHNIGIDNDAFVY